MIKTWHFAELCNISRKYLVIIDNIQMRVYTYTQTGVGTQGYAIYQSGWAQGVGFIGVGQVLDQSSRLQAYCIFVWLGYCMQLYRGLSPHTYTKKNKKRNAFPQWEYPPASQGFTLRHWSAPCQVYRVERKRLKASGIFGVAKQLDKRYIFVLIGGKQYGINPNPKT